MILFDKREASFSEERRFPKSKIPGEGRNRYEMKNQDDVERWWAIFMPCILKSCLGRRNAGAGIGLASLELEQRQAHRCLPPLSFRKYSINKDFPFPRFDSRRGRQLDLRLKSESGDEKGERIDGLPAHPMPQ